MKKILVCDDEAIIRQGIRNILMKAYDNLEIKEAENGVEGYKEIVLWNPEIVITDIKMPIMDGLKMLAKASQDNIHFITIVISAYSDFEYARTAIRYGVRSYLLKPINHIELLDCLNDILEHTKKPGVQETLTDSDSIRRAIRFIENNYYRNIGLEDVAHEIGLNPNYLSSLFRKQCKIRYIDYLTNIRMETARNLIQTTNLKINTIANMVGYSSTKHFSRLYKEKYGINPSEDLKK